MISFLLLSRVWDKSWSSDWTNQDFIWKRRYVTERKRASRVRPMLPCSEPRPWPKTSWIWANQIWRISWVLMGIQREWYSTSQHCLYWVFHWFKCFINLYVSFKWFEFLNCLFNICFIWLRRMTSAQIRRGTDAGQRNVKNFSTLRWLIFFI